MDYGKQLLTSAWLQRKYEILKRDNYVCSNCLADNSESQLQVHHICYIKNRKAWRYPDYLLVTLCQKCHSAENKNENTNNKNKIIEWIKRLATPKDETPTTQKPA